MGLLDSLGSTLQAGASGGLSVLGPGLSGDPNIVGDVLTGGAVSNNQAIQATNAQNISYAQQQEQFQANMSNTAYQRAVADMKAAGLNPMLAYSQGGASVPTGVSPDLQAPRPGDIGGGLFNTAKAIATGSADLQQTHSQIDLNKHNSDLASANVDKSTANAQESYQNIETSKQQQKKLQADTEVSRQKARQEKNAADVSDSSLRMDKAVAPFSSILGALKQALGVGSNAKDLMTSANAGGRARYTEHDMVKASKGKGVLVK